MNTLTRTLNQARNKFRYLGLVIAAWSLAACGAKGGIDIQAGQRTFASRCASCHQVGAYARAGFAPQLNGIVGRQAGATLDFKYSAAMKNAGIVWSEQNLSAFVRDPEQVVPGTTMRFRGLSGDAEVANLVAYLRTVAKTE